MDGSHTPPIASARTPTWIDETLLRARHALAAGVVYFLALVGAGWTFGPIRELAIGRGLDPLLAVLLETPAMLLVIAFASAWAIRIFRVRDRAGDRLMVGSVAVTLVMASEFIGGAVVRGWGFYETLTNLTTLPGSIFVGLLVVALLTPALEPLGLPKRAPRR